MDHKNNGSQTDVGLMKPSPGQSVHPDAHLILRNIGKTSFENSYHCRNSQQEDFSIRILLKRTLLKV